MQNAPNMIYLQSPGKKIIYNINNDHYLIFKKYQV